MLNGFQHPTSNIALPDLPRATAPASLHDVRRVSPPDPCGGIAQGVAHAQADGVEQIGQIERRPIRPTVR
jgi:hypothetical protein